MTKMHTEIWKNCLQVIKDNIPEDAFNTWFKPIKAEKFENQTLTLNVPTQFFYEFLEEHYIDLLGRVLKKEIGNDAKLRYSVNMSRANTSVDRIHYPAGTGINLKNKSVPIPIKQGDSVNPDLLPGIKKVHVDANLNDKYSFDNFVEGPCNKVAASAGKLIAAKPGDNPYNPIFIFGKTGMGKTHLAQAIGIAAKENFGEEKVVLYVAARNFEMQFTNAARQNERNDFLHFYQMIDILILDDVHEFANKPGTQDTFFHIFNHLHQSGKQLILTSDRFPSELKTLEDRLVSRFKWGLTAELQAPDFEMRMAILHKQAEAAGVEIPPNIMRYIAENITNNVRELEGALVSLLAEATLTKAPITFELAKRKIDHLAKTPKNPVTTVQIKGIVCDFLNLRPNELNSKSRKREIVKARQIAMYLSKKFTNQSLTEIGGEIGGKNHATVLYSANTVSDQLIYDKTLQALIRDLEKRIEEER
ncbi:MAG: chromosomal replication initiator protein DnaA [Bacteroidia bacterium]|nr:MAG: chromosomal replication initiator protein DnaA [Bacteroidia bacterium]